MTGEQEMDKSGRGSKHPGKASDFPHFSKSRKGEGSTLNPSQTLLTHLYEVEIGKLVRCRPQKAPAWQFYATCETRAQQLRIPERLWKNGSG